MGKPASPTPPDASKLIDQSTAANKDIAGYTFGLNAVNQVTPFGSQNYTRTKGKNGAPDSWTSTTTLSPGVQAIMDAVQGGQRSVAQAGATQAGNLNGSLQSIAAPKYQQFGGAPALKTSFDPGGVANGNIAGAGDIRQDINNAGEIRKGLSTNDYSADRQRVEDTLFGELDTKSGRDQATLETQLANKGIQVGSDAYTRAMSDFQKGRSSDRVNAILSAGQEQNRLQGLDINNFNAVNSAQAQQYSQNANDAAFYNSGQQQRFGQNQAQTAQELAAQQQRFGQNASMAGFFNDAGQQDFQNQNQLTGLNNQVNQQAFQDAISGNNQNINQTLALLNGAPVQQPTFGSTPQVGVGGTDVAGIAQQGYNNQVNAYNQQQQNLGGIFGTLGTLGSAVAPFVFSDERLKEDIEYDGDATSDGIPTADFRYIWDAPGTRRSGVIAQDVERVRPDAVTRIGGIRLVDSSKIREAA